MSSCYLVQVSMPGASGDLAVAQAGDGMFLNTRGRPGAAAQAARLESRDLALALLEASVRPLRERHGEAVMLEVVEAGIEDATQARRVAEDSEAVRDWLAGQTVATG